MNQIFKQLKAPYPIEISWKRELWKIGMIALSIPIFLTVFQPFGIFDKVDFNDTTALLAVLGFGIVCGFVTLVFWFMLPLLFGRFFENFILWQAICFFTVFNLFLPLRYIFM